MKTERLVFLSLLIAIALGLNFIESLIPVPIPIPGVKLGLANIITLFCLYEFNVKETITVLVLRIVLASFLFSSFSSMLYSLSGAFFSLTGMILFKRLSFSIITVGIIGGIMHNLGQIVCASLVVNSINLFYTYTPYLLLIGLFTGLFIGLATKYFLKTYTKILKRS